MNPDDPTPPAPSRFVAVSIDETALVSRGGRIGANGGYAHLVNFDCRRASLTVVLQPDGRVDWSFTSSGPPPAGTQEGGDLVWQFGRLVASGPDGRAFHGIRASLGLTSGQIEAELREVTKYRDGTE